MYSEYDMYMHNTTCTCSECGDRTPRIPTRVGVRRCAARRTLGPQPQFLPFQLA
jgi:hypothetical protein